LKNLQRYLYDVANARRRELLPYVFDQTRAQVQTGPFRGMKIVPHYMWGDGDTAAKLMGVYEDELHEWIEHSIAQAPSTVINVGSAEGYYSVGMALRLPGVPVLAVDLEPRAAVYVQENAAANGIKIQAIVETVTAQWLQEQCESQPRPLLILDCEGAEADLLDPVKAPALAKAMILVECHDCIIPNITADIRDRFSATHEVHFTKQCSKDPYQFKWLESLSDCDKWALVHEGRPSVATWLYMVPRS
jgi:hypothetical protein